MRCTTNQSSIQNRLYSIEFVAIGASLGGLNALKTIVSFLPDNFSTPIAIVLHRQASPQDYLTEALQKVTTIKVCEAIDKNEICEGTITVAPNDYHLLVDGECYALSLDEKVSLARPSIDVLFESVADRYGPAALAIVLTGGSHDGADGMASIIARGGQVMVQDPKTAEAPIMPEAAIASTLTDKIYPLYELGPQLLHHCMARNL